jgi:hypothetical protein
MRDGTVGTPDGDGHPGVEALLERSLEGRWFDQRPLEGNLHFCYSQVFLDALDAHGDVTDDSVIVLRVCHYVFSFARKVDLVSS